MKRSSSYTAVALLALAMLVACAKSPTNGPQDEAIAALKNLRDRGVLTPEEYDAKVATLTGRDEALKSLRSLRDRGVFSQAEYEAKVATLQGSPGPADATRAVPAVLGTGPSTGLPDNGAVDISGGGSDLGGGAAVPPPASAPRVEKHASRKTPRPVHREELTLGNSQPIELAAAADAGNSSSQSGSPASQDRNDHTNPVGRLWAKARAKAHDLEAKVLHRASQTPPPTNADPKALESYGQTLLNGDGLSGSQDGAQQNQPR